MSEAKDQHTVAAAAEWTDLPVAPIPPLTYWPALLALGATFLLWGFVTSLLISGLGLILLAIALGGWIVELRHE
ncbi:MAG: hypothetical protein R3C14_28175 [Caldilineaceae bacterium]